MTASDFAFGPPTLHSAPPAEARLDIDIGDLFKAVVTRWRLLPLALALTLSLAGAYMLLTPPRYAATMAFLVDTRERPPIGVDAAPVAQNPDAAIVESQMRLLLSNTVLKRVIESEKLRSDPQFAGGGSGGLLSKIKNFFVAAPTAAPAAVTDAALFGALMQSISVKRSDKSYVIDVEVRAPQAEKAERLARALAKAYFDSQDELGGGVVEKESKWLDAKIADLHDRLLDAEARVQDYRKSNAIVITEGLTPAEQQLKNADSALVAARGKRAEAEAKYEQGQTTARGGAGEAVPSPLLDKLRGEYAALARDAALAVSTLGPRHPSYLAIQSQLAVQRGQIERETRNVLLSLRRELEAAREVERLAEAQVAKLKQTINDGGGKRLELLELERRVESLRDNYQKALGTRDSSRRGIISSPNPVLINDPSAQAGQVSPKTTPALVIAAAAGVNLWIAAALLLEYLARKRGAREAAPSASQKSGGARDEATPATSGLGGSKIVALPSLGRAVAPSGDRLERDGALLGRVNRAMDRVDHPYRQAAAQIHERLRRSASSPEKALVAAIGARQAGAGASTLALALARAACDRGERVLILDCNLDHPTFAGFVPYLSANGRDGDDTAAFCACRNDARSGGAIFLGRCENDRLLLRRRSLAKRVDLVLLDCGAKRLLSDGIEEEIDAEIVVESDSAKDGRRAVLSFPHASSQRLETMRGAARSRRLGAMARKTAGAK